MYSHIAISKLLAVNGSAKLATLIHDIHKNKFLAKQNKLDLCEHK